MEIWQAKWQNSLMWLNIKWSKGKKYLYHHLLDFPRFVWKDHVPSQQYQSAHSVEKMRPHIASNQVGYDCYCKQDIKIKTKLQKPKEHRNKLKQSTDNNRDKAKSLEDAPKEGNGVAPSPPNSPFMWEAGWGGYPHSQPHCLVYF